MITKFGKQAYLQDLTQISENKAGAGDINTLRWCDKLKALYFHYHSRYGQQTWQDGNLPW